MRGLPLLWQVTLDSHFFLCKLKEEDKFNPGEPWITHRYGLLTHPIGTHQILKTIFLSSCQHLKIWRICVKIQISDTFEKIRKFYMTVQDNNKTSYPFRCHSPPHSLLPWQHRGQCQFSLHTRPNSQLAQLYPLPDR